ncbi:Zinc finger protein 25 [Eumeta japonica]|uniref:Zinc finger protein 25 n=1 Tax=Eumeta variegata TaxID=151549 RepID=A0A4C1T6Q1_EUMVA|nr:Zinc finger protein 25 [Eumeta japonica]
MARRPHAQVVPTSVGLLQSFDYIKNMALDLIKMDALEPIVKIEEVTNDELDQDVDQDNEEHEKPTPIPHTSTSKLSNESPDVKPQISQSSKVESPKPVDPKRASPIGFPMNGALQFKPIISKKGEPIGFPMNGPIGFPIIERPRPEKQKKARTREKRPKPPPTCDQCGRDFKTRVDLRSHMRTHTGERPYMCTECGKTYSQLGHLKVHIKSHTGDKQFPCSICHMAFYRNTDLDRHFRTHTGEKPFQCEICSKSFVQKSNLNMHMKAHSGDRAHQCTVCLKRFMTNSKLRLHLNKHNKVKSKDVPIMLAYSIKSDDEQKHLKPLVLELVIRVFGVEIRAFRFDKKMDDYLREPDATKTRGVVCGRCLSSTRAHRPMEWKRDRSFRALARTLDSDGTRQ